MAIYYTEDWAAGNTTGYGLQTSLYRRASPTNHPQDPTYPNMWSSEKVWVTAEGLDWWDDPGSGTDDYMVCGVTFKDFNAGGPAVGGVAGTGAVRAVWTFKTQAFTDGGAGYVTPLVAVRGKDHSALGAGDLGLMLVATGASTYEWQAWYRRWDDAAIVSATLAATRADIENTTRTFDVCWQACSAAQTDAVGPTDGWLTIKMDGVALFDIQNIKLYTNWKSGDASALNVWDRVEFGYLGMPGPLSTFTISSDCLEYDTPSSNNLLTGSTHTVTGSNNLIAGTDGTVTGDRNVLLALCGSPTSITGNNTFKVCADAIELIAPSVLVNGNPVIGYAEYDAGNSGTSLEIDWSNGAQQIVTLTGNVTFTFVNPTLGRVHRLILVQDATGGRTVTWPASVKWPADTPPTIDGTASKATLCAFAYTGLGADGYLGTAAGVYTPPA